jgi:mannose-6-phosphate isomerase-like protein (cupin superfamily)
MNEAATVIRNLQNAEHYIWGNGCDGWRLLGGQDLAVIQERMPAGTREVLHWHDRARQLFFVLTGRLQIALDAETHDLMPGDTLEIPPGRKHQVRNVSDDDAAFLVISAPATRDDRIEPRG